MLKMELLKNKRLKANQFSLISRWVKSFYNNFISVFNPYRALDGSKVEENISNDEETNEKKKEKELEPLNEQSPKRAETNKNNSKPSALPVIKEINNSKALVETTSLSKKTDEEIDTSKEISLEGNKRQKKRRKKGRYILIP